MAIRSLARSSVRQAGRTNSALAGYESNYFHHLETVRLGGTAASVTFSNLSRYSDYQHFQVRALQRASVADTGMQGIIRFNGDSSTSSYAMHQLFGNGSSVSTEAVTSGFLGGIAPMGRFPGANATANTFGGIIIDILDPFDTTKNTTVRALGGSASSENRVQISSGLWLNNAAVTSIYFQPQDGSSWVTGCRFSLYGLKARA